MDAYQWPRPAVTVDIVVFTVLDADLKVLLIRRKLPPFEGQLALPGGYVRVSEGPEQRGESVEQAAYRELEEETGLPPKALYLEQLYTYGEPGRDPRMRTVSVAWYALVRPELAPMVLAGTDAAAAEWASLSLGRPPLAFDHDLILEQALERVRGKVDYSDIAFELVPRTFSTSELRTVFEAVKGEVYDAANFRRRFRRLIEDGLVEQAPGHRTTGKRRAAVYRFVKRDG